jgi:hypothetical protein
MTTEEVLEKNKLIAEFMGGKMIVTDYHGINIIEFPDKSTKDLHGLKYHKSFDWLIPVVEKIESIHDDFHGYFGVHITSNSCAIQGTKLNTSIENPHYAYFAEWHGTTKIEATYIAVVNWIRWWNQKQKEHGNN